MQLENNAPPHVAAGDIDGQHGTELDGFMDRIKSDPDRRTTSGVAFSAEVLGVASWYRRNDRPVFDLFNNDLTQHMGAVVFRWRVLVTSAPPTAPGQTSAAEQLPEVEPANDPVEPAETIAETIAEPAHAEPAEPVTSARFDDPDDLSDAAMAQRAAEQSSDLARYFDKALAAIDANDPTAARQLAGAGAPVVIGAPDELDRVLRAIGKGRTVDPAELAAARAVLARGPGAHDDTSATTTSTPATSWAAELGITEHTGADAAADAREAHREAMRNGAPDPLEGLPERITTSGDPALAFDPLAIGAALDLRNDDGPAFQSLRGALKRAGVILTEWSRALDAEARRRKVDAKAAEREGQQRAAQARREAVEAARAAVAAKFAAERAERPAVEAHFNQAESNGATFTMEPGRVVMEAMTNQGIKRTELANFSAPIVAHTLELDAPDAKPRGTYTLSVVLAGCDTPREVDVDADRFARMEWVEPALGPRAVVAPGKGSRDNLRAALGYLSSPVTRQRCGFVGWVRHAGGWVYLHAGGAIGEGGAVEGLAATPPAPVDRFALPAPPTGDELARAVGAVVALLSMEPAPVTVPMVALAFHAPLGGSRCAVHVNGPAELGKSVRASLVQRLFGAAMNAKAPPASWADGSTAIGISQVLARAGDALVMVDDLRVSGGSRDEADAVKVDRVLRAHFNGAAPLKGRREGGGRTDPASRCNVLSTGETLPKGSTASTLNRVVTVELDAPLPANIGELDARATAGELAGGMAAFLRWLAPQVEDLRPKARLEERAAALRWGFTARSRATELLGGLCLGMEFLLRWLAAEGVPAVDVERHRVRAQGALHDVAGEHGERVAEEGIAPRFVALVSQGLRSGLAHVVEVQRNELPGGALRTVAPGDSHLWGYQRRGDTLAGGGPLIGYLIRTARPSKPSPITDAVCLSPAAALTLARKVGRENGQTLGADRAAVGAALHAAGLLARTDVGSARGTVTTRVRIASGGGLVDVWALKLSALGYDDAGDDTDDEPAPVDDGTGPAPGDVPEFPTDLDPFTP